MKKRIVSLLLVLVLAVGLLPASVQAAETGSFLHGYAITDGMLTVNMAKMPEGGQFQVSLGGQSLEVTAKTVKEADLPVTVYCLVDVSGSIYGDQLAMIRKVLTTISDQMGEGDNMVICALGEDTKASGLLNTKAERSAAIKGLKLKDEDTNLYAGMVECLNLLRTSTVYNTRRCLVVFSDGQDFKNTGYTRQEVEAAITTTRLPVYTVSVLRSDIDRAKTETSKKFGSLARISAGGEHFTPLVEDDKGGKAGNAIWSSLQEGIQLQADLNGVGFDYSKDVNLLRVVYTTDSASYEDTWEIYTEELPPAPTEPPTTEPTTVATTEPTTVATTTAATTAATTVPTESTVPPEPVPDPVNWVMWGIIGGILLLAIAAIVFILLRRRQQQEALRLQQEQERLAKEQMEREIEEARKRQEELSRTRAIPTPAVPGRKILMVAIRHEDTQYRYTLNEGVPKTMGKQADIVLNVQDSQLSRRHCEIKWEGDRMYVRDESSLNGTFIHGVPIKGKGWMPLENHGILHVGTYDYRVSFEDTLL